MKKSRLNLAMALLLLAVLLVGASSHPAFVMTTY